MSALKKLQTGVPGLDILTHGGIPEGRSTLIAGKSGTGKTVVGLQIASNLARQGVPTIIVAVEESPSDLQDSGDSLGLGTSRSVRQGTLHFADVTRPMDGPTLVSGEYDLSGLTHRLEALANQTGARACIIDSATALFSPRPPAGRAAQPFLPARIRVAEDRRDIRHPRRGAKRLRPADDDGGRGLRLRSDHHPQEHRRRRPPPPLD